ncbi:amidohydrolase family protein [Nocardia sp. alder85J]|uniref:amidohydrolase family protein n=1 Tax=Nocardia sp. alder85J TaxID=2862949 RepID=UPI001CD2A81F|nr:amidohydrolase family protein [Nocardia sp. alder85J]MCX4092398.1 amidohydrolase family protein [Nocardia sp. alder85J]
MTDMLIRDAEVSGARTDVLVRDGIVAAVGGSPAVAGMPVLDARGGALLPGLHDHHLHLHAMAAEADSVRCGPPRVHTGRELATALATAPGSGWIRGVGYVETVAGLLDSTTLDALCRERPVRMQHRSGAMWILNSAAAGLVDLASATEPGVERDERGRATGRIWRADTWLRSRLPDTGPPDTAAVGQQLAAYGITGITDATPDLTPDSLANLIGAVASGAIPQRVQLLGVPLGHTGIPAIGAAGTALRGSEPAVTVGPYKIVIADSDLPDLVDLEETVRRAHESGRPVAVHCVSREALLILLAVFDATGTIAGDRIEHGALVPAESLDSLRRFGLTVVTQPGFLADRGDDYLHRVDPRDLPDLYRCRSLCEAGVSLALSSDAPYGPADPWQVIAAATERRAPDGSVVGAAETLSATAALDRYLAPLDDPGGPARTVTVGATADLVLLDRPIAQMYAQPSSAAVRYTLIGGTVVYERP